MTDNEIELVVNNYRNHFLIDEIKDGKPIYRNSNKIWRVPGGLCSVYKFQIKDGNIKALRIWKSLISKSQERYESISNELNKINSQYFVNFKFIKNAFSFNGICNPVVLMDWCDGIGLKKYIYNNIDNSQKIEKLASSFLTMAYQLHKYGISHGDLQHENILVKKDGSIVLIDYDTMFVPRLKGFKDECEGYSGYQHPTARMNNKILSPKIDYFSELILYLSIRAIAKNKSLFDKYLVEEQDQSMLFTVFDLKKLRNSTIYHDIKNLGNDFSILLNILESYLLKTDINDLEPFYILAKRMGLQFQVNENIITIDKNEYMKIHENVSFVSKYCNQCGKRYEPDRSKFCSKCGNKRF